MRLNADFRAMEYDTSAGKDEFHQIQMENFAIHVREKIEPQRHLNILQLVAESILGVSFSKFSL